MSGKEILADTNIILYLLKGSDTLEGLLQGKDLHLSFITELELIGYRNITRLRPETELRRAQQLPKSGKLNPWLLKAL